MPSFIKHIEIPVKISYEYQPKEYATQTYPGCAEQCMIEDVEICNGDEEVVKNLDELIEWVTWDNDFESNAFGHHKEITFSQLE